LSKKYVYLFKEGRADMRELLGGKGANLAEMTNIGLPVPQGFTVSTEACTRYYEDGRVIADEIMDQIYEALAITEKLAGKKFGDLDNPYLVSVRSGARASMPGMMDTILNLGLNDVAVQGLANLTGNERFAYDSYRRFIQMFSDVVMEVDKRRFDEILDAVKKENGVKLDTELTADNLKDVVKRYKAMYKTVKGEDFPQDPKVQLIEAIKAVFRSWDNPRANVYRRMNDIPYSWGTAVNVQSMVFGNMGESSATGVAFSRNPATGENKFYGEWLVNAQGEDVVAGIRTPNPLNNATKNEQNKHLPSLQEAMSPLYKQLDAIRISLEKHYRDMQDIEFTIQEGKLYILQCRNGKRTGTAALNMAMDMLEEKLIDEKTLIQRVEPGHLDQLLHPFVDPAAEAGAKLITKGLPAGPGGATGQIVFTAEEAVAGAAQGKKVILVREETNPEDVEGMRAAQGILTARGGMTSHAALVARGWGKCCIVGAGDIHVTATGKKMTVRGVSYNEGDWITLNGTRGVVYEGKLPMIDASENPRFKKFMQIVDKHRTIGVRTNADTPADARVARAFGAEGIGLFRTEHMFYGVGSDEPLFLLRKMILSKDEAERRRALDELFPFVKRDIKNTLEAMEGLPVTIRLLDPPLHEFVPQSSEKQAELAGALGINAEDVRKRGEALHESNPMMGHRGVRLGITYPEVTEMQVRAIFEAAAELNRENKKCKPEIMIPVTGEANELKHQKVIITRVHNEVCKKMGVRSISHMVGTMIEIPRAALLADRIAEEAEFFSFGTNDLTQMSFGFSRDDIGGFLPEYLEKKILPADPFQTIDQDGVGQLIRMSVERGRATRKDLKIGICGEQGGDPASVEFCNRAGLTYVSCSPFRVPIARLAAAQAALKAQPVKKGKVKVKAKVKAKAKKVRTAKKAKAKTATKAKGKAKKK